MRLRSLIQHPDHQSASIGQLAFQAGFASGSHANRSFSDVYGTTPGRLRLASSEPQPDGTGQSLQAGLHQWLSGLT
jgi:transcriptional regulator GlxA family with amidase domain